MAGRSEVAEGEGFEPSTPVSQSKRLAGARTRPLCDPSAQSLILSKRPRPAATSIDCGMSILSRLLSQFRRDAASAPERLPSPDELVVLARPGGEPEALMLQELLAADGIHALVRNRDGATARGGGWGPSWAYELCVLRRDLRKAQAIIGEDGTG